MKKESYSGHFGKGAKGKWTKKQILLISGIGGLVLILAIGLAMFFGRQPDIPEPATVTRPTTDPAEATTEDTRSADEADATEQTTLPEETEPVMLESMAGLYAENPDLAGWLHIEGTVIDYSVMYTPEDGEKYIYANFQGHFDANGLIFIDANCSVEPESDNLILYGHNMRSGAMFGSLMYYAKESYWQEHPIIEYSTLYEEREYEIIAAFYDRVYKKSDTCFKFYQFINADNEWAFQEAMDYFKENACYETGVTAQYGDSLITLVTCAYHVSNGRFVVVARKID